MILRREYLEDLKDLIRQTPDEDLQRFGYTRDTLLQDVNRMERLWMCYQKDMEYGAASGDAYRNALYVLSANTTGAAPS